MRLRQGPVWRGRRNLASAVAGHREHAAPVPWPGPSITSVTKLVDIGLSEDGRPVQVLIARRNVLIGGIAGAGKSGVLNVIIATLAACQEPTNLYLVSPRTQCGAVGRGPERRNRTPAVGRVL